MGKNRMIIAKKTPPVFQPYLCWCFALAASQRMILKSKAHRNRSNARYFGLETDDKYINLIRLIIHH